MTKEQTLAELAKENISFGMGPSSYDFSYDRKWETLKEKIIELSYNGDIMYKIDLLEAIKYRNKLTEEGFVIARDIHTHLIYVCLPEALHISKWEYTTL